MRYGLIVLAKLIDIYKTEGITAFVVGGVANFLADMGIHLFDSIRIVANTLARQSVVISLRRRTSLVNGQEMRLASDAGRTLFLDEYAAGGDRHMRQRVGVAGAGVFGSYPEQREIGFDPFLIKKAEWPVREVPHALESVTKRSRPRVDGIEARGALAAALDVLKKIEANAGVVASTLADRE